jgi:diaminopimelate epimerase
VVAGIERGLLDREVRVTTRGGDLLIRWPGQGEAVMMTGDAVRVFDGELEIEA